VPVQLEFPWNRGEAAAPEHAEAYGGELAALVARVTEDEAAALAAFSRRQLHWYATHRRTALDLQPALAPLAR
jgi:hypothetical protein